MIEEIESREKASILLSFLTQTHLIDSRMFIRNTLAYLVADLAKFSGNEVAHWSIGEKDGVLKIFKEYRKHKDREALRAALKLLPYTCNLDYYPFFQLDVLKLDVLKPEYRDAELKAEIEKCNLEFIALDDAKSESSTLLRASSKPKERDSLLRPASGVAVKETESLLRPSEIED